MRYVVFVFLALALVAGSAYAYAGAPAIVNPLFGHVVRYGDTLFAIASAYGTSVDEIVAVNPWIHDPNWIYPGQEILVPISPEGWEPRPERVYASSYEFDLLARLIRAEAGGEPYLGQVAVGAVVINRVLDPEFPDTIQGVILQRTWGFAQFTPIDNGTIWLPATQTAKDAAREALEGSDPTGGALYFYNPTTDAQNWVRTRRVLTQIGGHIFAI